MIPHLAPKQYASAEAFAHEQRALFRRSWQLAGLTSQLAQNNDYLALELGGQSVVVQNFGGKLNAFHNVCSHRHARIRLDAAGNGPLRCPYHGWTYDDAGLPVGIPGRACFAELTPGKVAALALTRWRVETLGPLVLVTADPNAPSPASWLGPLHEPIQAYAGAMGRVIDVNEVTIRANWKIVVENGIEGYHTPIVHKATIQQHGVVELGITFAGPSSSTRFKAESSHRSRRAIDLAFPGRPVVSTEYVYSLLFPNIAVASIYGAIFIVNRVHPVGPAETRLTSWVFETKHDPHQTDLASLAETISRSNVAFIRRTYEEDARICEAVQLGVAEASREGLLSSEENRVFAFQEGCAKLLSETA